MYAELGSHPVTVSGNVALFFIRLGTFVLSALAIGIAVVPILVLIDLLDGGTGWGLCPAGLEACANPYTTAAEFAVMLTLGFLATVIGIRLLMRLARHIRSGEYQVTQ
ncbi:MAG TPA: hypothetical protein VI980_03660 [Acidimicrobiia bacterium]|nr:hypothetical protein [Acidimicrobiia bacterium]